MKHIRAEYSTCHGQDTYRITYYAPHSDPDGRGTGLNLSTTIEARSITEALDIFKGKHPKAYNIYARKARHTTQQWQQMIDEERAGLLKKIEEM